MAKAQNSFAMIWPFIEILHGESSYINYGCPYIRHCLCQHTRTQDTYMLIEHTQTNIQTVHVYTSQDSIFNYGEAVDGRMDMGTIVFDCFDTVLTQMQNVLATMRPFIKILYS